MKPAAKRGIQILGASACLLLSSCWESDASIWNRGYEAGYDRGRSDGLRVGEETGRATAERSYKRGEFMNWGTRGLAVGIGGGFLAATLLLGFIGRRHYGARFAEWRRRRELERFVEDAGLDLDEPIQGRLIDVLRLHQSIEEDLPKVGDLSDSLEDKLRPELATVPRRALKLAKVQQKLVDSATKHPRSVREIEDEIGSLKRRLDRGVYEMDPDREGARSDEERDALSEKLDLLKARRDQQQTLKTNLTVCRAKMDSLRVLLESISVQIANWETVENLDAFDEIDLELTKEVDNLETFVRDKLEELAVSID